MRQQNRDLLSEALAEVADSILPALPAALLPYRDDPVGFVRDILGARLTPEQEQVANSILNNRITLVRSANAVGKSHCAAHIALWFARCHIGAQVFTAAAPPETNLRTILWGEIDTAWAKASPEMKRGVRARVMHLIFGDKWGIQGVTIPTSGTPQSREARFSGRHAPYLMFILDEADAIPLEVWKGIESCVSGGLTRILIMLNPRHPSGWTYSLAENRDVNIITLSALNHPNVVTGNDVVPGAVTGEVTVRRIQTWSRPLVEGEPYEETATLVVPDYLDGRTTAMPDGSTRTPLVGGQRRVVTEPMLDYMTLGRYSGISGTQLIPRSHVLLARERWRKYVEQYGRTPPKVIPRIGFDVADYEGADSSALCYRYGDWVAPIRTWKGLQMETTGDRLVETLRDTQYETLAVDSIGVGAGLPGQLRRKGLDRITAVKTSERPTRQAVSESGDVLGDFRTLRDQLFWQLKEWLRPDGNAMLPDDDELEAELIAPTYSFAENGKIKVDPKSEMKTLLGRSPDRLDALVLTFAEPARVKVGFA